MLFMRQFVYLYSGSVIEIRCVFYTSSIPEPNTYRAPPFGPVRL